MSTSLLHSRAYQYATAKFYVFSDSVLCMGNWETILLNPGTRANFKGIRKINFLKDLNRIDRQPVELEWKIFPGFTTVGIFNKIQRMMEQLQCEPENFTGRIIFRSMCNDTVWDSKGNNEIYENNSKTIQQYARRFPRGHWSFQGPGSEKKWYGTNDGTPDGSWNQTAERMLQNFEDSRHPIFRCISLLERGQLEAKQEERQQFTSMEVRKISRCSSRWSSLSISSVFTDQ